MAESKSKAKPRKSAKQVADEARQEDERRLSAQQRLFVNTYAILLSVTKTADALNLPLDTCKDWNSKAKNPHIRQAIEVAIASRFDEIKAQMEVAFRENWERIFESIWEIHDEARAEKDRKNALRALEKLAKIAGLSVTKTELSGPGGDPIVIQHGASDDDDSPQFEGWPEEKIQEYISLRRQANMLAKTMGAASAHQDS